MLIYFEKSALGEDFDYREGVTYDVTVAEGEGWIKRGTARPVDVPPVKVLEDAPNKSMAGDVTIRRKAKRRRTIWPT